MTFFQRIKTPFTESAADDEARLQPRQRQVGDILQARREDLGLDLDEIGAMLRIKPAYLAALEQGRSDDLPGPAYAIGFVRAYADFLGLNTEQVLARFKGETAGVTARPDLALPVPLGERSLPGRALVLVALIVALCGYGIWYYLSTEDRNRPERVAAVPVELQTPVLVAPPPLQQPTQGATPPNPIQTAPPPDLTGAAANPNAAAPAKPAPPTPATPPQQVAVTAQPKPAPPTVTPQPASATPPQQATAATQPKPASAVAATPAPLPPAAPQQVAAAAQPTPPPQQAAVKPSPLPATAAAAPAPTAASKISIRALADCWIQVRAPDQSIVFSRILKSGEVYNVPSRSGLSLRTGNAGVLEIAVDGRPAPSIGGIGTLRRDVALDPMELVAGTAVHG